MALFSKQYLFSEVRGVVVVRGEPVAGAEVERWFSWKAEEGTDRVSTGADGSFRLPAITRSSWSAALLPHEPVVGQKLVIRHDGREHEAWVFSKHDYDENGELAGRSIDLVCDLASEPGYKQLAENRGQVFGLCELR